MERAWPVSGAVQSIAAVDGLRAFAVLQVVVFHLLLLMWQSKATSQPTWTFLHNTKNYWESFTSGVHLFFVLSGFLLFMPYARALLDLGSWPSARKFYVRRALRILPA